MIDGFIVSVHDETAGSELSADASATDTTISVVDLADFNLDPDGGSLKLDDGTNTETKTYTIPSGSTGTVTLGSGLANSYLTGTRVTVLVNGMPVIERWADLRQPDGEELLRALVPHHLRMLLPVGPRDEDAGAAEHVRAEFEDEDLVITNVLGKPVTGLDLQALDTLPPVSGEDQIQWTRQSDGALVASIYAYAVGGAVKDVLQLLAYELSGTGGASVQLGAAMTGGLGTNLLLTVQTGGGAANQYVYVQVPNDAGGSVSKYLLRGDGTSDFALDTSGGWQNWTPTLSGWSANPTNSVYRYRQVGKTVHIVIRQATAGTSNATTKSLTAPVAAANVTNALWSENAMVTDNGTDLAAPGGATIAAGSSTINFSKDLSANTGGFTASGNCKIRSVTLIYEAA